MAHETNHEARAVLHAPLAGAEGRGPAAGTAGLARSDELADLSRGVQHGIVGVARWLLARAEIGS